MKMPEWIVNLPICPTCGQHYYQGNGFRLHIVVMIDANGCVRLRYHVACEQAILSSKMDLSDETVAHIRQQWADRDETSLAERY